MKSSTTNRREFLLKTLAIPTAALVAMPLLAQDKAKAKDAKDKAPAPEAPKVDAKDAKGDAKAKGKGGKAKGDAKAKDDAKK